jgi:2-polyprenyl-6-methoxyphenol hydroxylase-like FAD-dependent oxidoreductase
LTPIAGYRTTQNRLRHYDEVNPWPKGLIVLGDAVCAFNPVYAQGMTTAALAVDTLDRTLTDSATRSSRSPQKDVG